MAIKHSHPLNFRAVGCSDTFDGSNVFAGAMLQLSNLIPAPQAQDAWVARPASVQTTAFGGFNTPAQGEALFDNGNRVYGFIQTSRFAGKSEPFIFDISTNTFVTISGIVSGNLPTSTSNVGDWTPPTIDRVGSRVLFTHPGFDGATHFFGWLDMSNFTSTTITGNTHSNTTVDTFSTPVLAAGWRPGMTITDSAGDLPAGTTIVSINSAGTSLVLSAAATGSNAGTTFTVSGGSFANPLWCAGNTSINPLLAVPTAVAQYAGSACFAVNTTNPVSSAVVFSDAGDPLLVTNASQIITFQNALPITALRGMPLGAQITGGIIQSLMAFQGATAIQQILGAPSTSNLTINALNDATGTLAPNSIVSTPKGMLFAAPDGIRRIDQFAIVKPVTGRRGMGISTPFIFAINPSRMCAAYNEGVYRISVNNGALVNPTTQEWWYHEDDDRWTGPHTFPAAIITATPQPHVFTMFAFSINAKLWDSACFASNTSTYVENGMQMAYAWQTVLLPDNQQAAMNACIKTNVAIRLPTTFDATVTAVDDTGVQLDVVTVPAEDNTSLWGSGIWGTSIWGGGAPPLRERPINWHGPLVYKQMSVTISGYSGYALQIGNFYMLNQLLGYNILTRTG